MSDHLLVLTPAAVLDAVSRAVVATDPDGSIIYWNRGAELLYGWSAEEVVGTNIVELLVPRAMAGEAAAILERVRVGEEWTGEFVTRHEDGRTLSVVVTDRAVVDVVGDVRGKGVDAAAVTGRARHTIRSIALYESRPSAILSHLNRVLLAAEADRVAAVRSLDDTPWELTEPRFCTVAVALVEPREGRRA